jgi:hypothetical protein
MPPGEPSTRPQPPAPSERSIRVGDRDVLLRLAPPATVDGWWVTVLSAGDHDGAWRFRDLGPIAGPPPEPPLLRLGPALAGGLSGLILEENGRLAIRLAPTVPPDDPARPWEMPVVVRAAFRFEPMRASVMSDAELGETVLTAFARSVEALRRPMSGAR